MNYTICLSVDTYEQLCAQVYSCIYLINLRDFAIVDNLVPPVTTDITLVWGVIFEFEVMQFSATVAQLSEHNDARSIDKLVSHQQN